MAGRDIIVIGFSAGGLEALITVVAGLPADYEGSLFVVHHFPAASISVLPAILERNGALPARHATRGEPIVPGRIYVAPPDRHLLLDRRGVVLSRGPRENGHRPAVDPLFRTAAKTFGPRVVGILLSGTLDDGTTGLQMVKDCGGVAVVQDPSEAVYSGMPASALSHVAVDHVLPVSRMASLLQRLTAEPIAHGVKDVVHMSIQESETPDPALRGAHDLDIEPLLGPPVALSCPECGGALWELRNGELIRYRCHVGHAYTAENMVVLQGQVVESALWSAIRALEEKADLSDRLAERARKRGWGRSSTQFSKSAQEARDGSESIRQLLLEGVVDVPAVEEEG